MKTATNNTTRSPRTPKVTVEENSPMVLVHQPSVQDSVSLVFGQPIDLSTARRGVTSEGDLYLLGGGIVQLHGRMAADVMPLLVVTSPDGQSKTVTSCKDIWQARSRAMARMRKSPDCTIYVLTCFADVQANTGRAIEQGETDPNQAFAIGLSASIVWQYGGLIPGRTFGCPPCDGIGAKPKGE